MAKTKAAEKKDAEQKEVRTANSGAADSKKEGAKVPAKKEEDAAKAKVKDDALSDDKSCLKQNGKPSKGVTQDDLSTAVQTKAPPSDNKTKGQPAIEKKSKNDAKEQPSSVKKAKADVPSKSLKSGKEVKKAKDMTKEEAATKIQSQARGYNDRQKTKSWWPFSSSKTATKDGKQSEEDKMKAGAKAAKEAEKQKQLASKNAEKEAKKAAKDKKKDPKKAKEMTKDEAATKIQSQARGYNGRQKAKSWWPFSSSKAETTDGKTDASEKKAKKEAEKAAKEAEKQKKLAEKNAEMEAKKAAKGKKKNAGKKAEETTKDEAATKIQSQARGYNAREKKSRWRPWGGSKSPHPILDSESGKKGGASGAVDSAASKESQPGSGKKKTPTKATNNATATATKAGSVKKTSPATKAGEKGAAAAQAKPASGTKARASNEGDLLALAAATELNKDDDSFTPGMLSSLPSTPQVSTKKMGPPSDEDRQKLLRESERLSTEVFHKL